MAITIKKSVSFTAPDGSIHTSVKAAEAYVLNQEIQAKLAAFEGYVTEEEGLSHGQPLSAYLFENKDAIMAALNPKVDFRQRKPRTPKAKPATQAPLLDPATQDPTFASVPQ